MPDVCIVDPWYSCNPADRPRTVLRLHCDDLPTDPYYAQTALLLNFETNGNDSSAAGKAMQFTGAGAVTNTRGRFGALAYENTAAGSTHGLETVASNVLAASNALPLSVDVWIYRTSSGVRQSFLSLPGALDLWVETDGRIGYWAGFFDNVQADVVPLNAWTLITLQASALVSGSRSFRLFVNGVGSVGGSGALSFTAAAGSKAAIGKGRHASFIGSIGPVRIDTAARYDINSNFRVVAAPFATRAQPLLVDTSCAYPKTVTTFGVASTSAERTLFGPRSLYVPELANYALNSSNGVQIAPHADFNFGTSDFTLRLWFNRLTANTSGRLFTAEMSGGEFNAFVSNSNFLTLNYRSNGGQQTWVHGSATPLNTWRQLLVQRRGAQWETYLQGQLVDSRSITGGAAATVNWNGNLWLGRLIADSASVLNGFLDEIDIVAGAALANGNFTVPDLPTCDYGGPNYWAAGARVWPAGIPQ